MQIVVCSGVILCLRPANERRRYLAGRNPRIGRGVCCTIFNPKNAGGGGALGEIFMILLDIHTSANGHKQHWPLIVTMYTLVWVFIIMSARCQIFLHIWFFCFNRHDSIICRCQFPNVIIFVGRAICTRLQENILDLYQGLKDVFYKQRSCFVFECSAKFYDVVVWFNQKNCTAAHPAKVQRKHILALFIYLILFTNVRLHKQTQRETKALHNAAGCH